MKLNLTRKEKINLILALQKGEKFFYSPIIIKQKDGTYESNGRIISESRMKSLTFPKVIILPDNGREEYDNPEERAKAEKVLHHI